MQGKHKGNRNPYTDQRDIELARAFREAKKHLLNEKGYIILREAVDIARCSPCSRYFVSEQRASIVISQLLIFDNYIKSLTAHHPQQPHLAASPVTVGSAAHTQPSSAASPPPDPLSNMLYQKRRMFSHLFMVYKRLKQQHPDYTHEELVTVACATPADEFYLTVSSATIILSRIHINASNKNGYTSNRKLTNRK